MPMSVVWRLLWDTVLSCISNTFCIHSALHHWCIFQWRWIGMLQPSTLFTAVRWWSHSTIAMILSLYIVIFIKSTWMTDRPVSCCTSPEVAPLPHNHLGDTLHHCCHAGCCRSLPHTWLVKSTTCCGQVLLCYWLSLINSERQNWDDFLP
jgi:hypothetical protein